MLITFIDLFLHLDRHLGEILQYFGVWTYVLLFLIIFCETGLVVTPILPGIRSCSVWGPLPPILISRGRWKWNGSSSCCRLRPSPGIR